MLEEAADLVLGRGDGLFLFREVESGRGGSSSGGGGCGRWRRERNLAAGEDEVCRGVDESSAGSSLDFEEGRPELKETRIATPL